MKKNIVSIKKGLVMPLFSNPSRMLVCFSHLRWDFVYQRPQQLLSRLAQSYKVFFIEEPIFSAISDDYYEYRAHNDNLMVIIPHLRNGLAPEEAIIIQKKLFDQFMAFRAPADPVFWYYTPMALEFTRKHQAALTVFDCMDELSAFSFAPENLKALEKELLTRADLVFTGGNAIYEAKKDRHNNVYSFPSSVDTSHFGKARTFLKTGDEIKLGYFGVIDERFDTDLIRQLADAKPEWQFILVGPVVKIDPASLPVRSNIHYAGMKNQQELLVELANWDIALIPFLLNESTRFISPTKTPEYLAAGKPVISTPIRDVINPYGKMHLVHIGHNADDFIAAAELELKKPSRIEWLKRVDAFLRLNSWDQTVKNMQALMNEVLEDKMQHSVARS